MTLLRLPRKHARTHLPGGSDPMAGVPTPASIFVNKSPSTVNVTTPWSAQSTITDWTFSLLEGPTVASYFEYDTDVGDGHPGVRILTGGIYVFKWFIWIAPQSTGTTNTGKLIPKFSQFTPIVAAASSASFAGATKRGDFYQNRGCTLDGGVNEISVRAGTDPPALSGEETITIFNDDADLPWIVTTLFTAAAGAHDYSYFSPNLRITRIGDYFSS